MGAASRCHSLCLAKHDWAAGCRCHLVPRRTATRQAPVTYDLFDGHPLRYRRADDGRYLLYSIGWNTKDDGGKMESPKTGEWKAQWSKDKGDWVWEGVPRH